MELFSLYDFARQQNIEVIPFPMKENGSMSVLTDSGACVIGIDDRESVSLFSRSTLRRRHFPNNKADCDKHYKYDRRNNDGQLIFLCFFHF